MAQLKPASFGAERLAVTLNRFYELVRQGIVPPGVVVRLGRQLRVHPERLEEFIARGGQALPGGWRREPREAAGASSTATGSEQVSKS